MGLRLKLFKRTPPTPAPPEPFGPHLSTLPGELLIQLLQTIIAFLGVSEFQNVLEAYPSLRSFVVLVTDTKKTPYRLFTDKKVKSISLNNLASQFTRIISHKRLFIFSYVDTEHALAQGDISSSNSCLYGRHLSRNAVVLVKAQSENSVIARLLRQLSDNANVLSFEVINDIGKDTSLFNGATDVPFNRDTPNKWIPNEHSPPLVRSAFSMGWYKQKGKHRITTLVLDHYRSFTVCVKWKHLTTIIVSIEPPPNCACSRYGEPGGFYYDTGKVYIYAPKAKEVFLSYKGNALPDIFPAHLATATNYARRSNRFTLCSERWSLSKPFGEVCTALESRVALATASVNPLIHTNSRWEPLQRFGVVKLQGLSDAFVYARSHWKGLYYFHWERLAHRKPQHTVHLPILCDDLVTLKYFSIVRKKDQSYNPCFVAPRIEEINLFALPGSDTAWELDRLMRTRVQLKKLQSVSLIGQVEEGTQEEYLPVDFRSLGRTSLGVSYLTILGYTPVFLMEPPVRDRVYNNLVSLRVDISQYPLTQKSAVININEVSFPKLSHLTLEVPGCLDGLTVAESLRVTVPPACRVFKLSSILSQIPELSVNGDVLVMQKLVKANGWQTFYRKGAQTPFTWDSLTRCIQSTANWLIAKDVAYRYKYR